MKKTVLCGLMLCLLLVGCQAKDTTTEPDATTSPPPTQTQQSESTEPPMDFTGSEPTKLRWAMTPLLEGVSQVQLPEEISNMEGFFFLSDKLYLSAHYQNQDGIVVYSPFTDEILDFYSLGLGSFQPCSDDGFLYTSYTGSIYRMENGDSEPALAGTYDRSVYLSYLPDGTSLTQSDDKILLRYGIDGTVLAQYDTQELGTPYGYGALGFIDEKIYAGYYTDSGNYLLVLDPQGEILQQYPQEEGISLVGILGDQLIGLSQYTGRLWLYDPAYTEINSFPLTSEPCTLRCAGSSCLLLSDATFVTLWNTDGQLLYAEKTGDTNRYLIGTGFWNGKFYLSYFDPAAPSSPYLIEVDPAERTALSPDEALALPGYPEGVTILTGADAVTEVVSYSITPSTDAERDASARQFIEEQLSYFPEGFFEEMLGGNSRYHSLVISFVDSLNGNGENTLGTAGGLCHPEKNTIFLWVTQDMIEQSQTIVHELMHAIEYSLEGRNVYFTDWNRYLPPDFQFENSYVAEGSFAYTEAGEAYADDIWFDTLYSKTYPTEDRADLFALMFTNNPYYPQFPHIYDRMEYLAQVLRENFQSVQNADSVIWEEIFS